MRAGCHGGTISHVSLRSNVMQSARRRLVPVRWLCIHILRLEHVRRLRCYERLPHALPHVFVCNVSSYPYISPRDLFLSSAEPCAPPVYNSEMPYILNLSTCS